MTTLVVHPTDRPLIGSIPVPPDPRIGCCALLLGALGEGKTHISGFSPAPDGQAAKDCLRALGVIIEEPAAGRVVVTGVGLGGLRAPSAVLDCAQAVTAMHLVCGVLAAQRFRATLTGTEALAREHWTNLVGPLRARGAVIVGRPDARVEGEITGPLVVGPLPEGRSLMGLEHESAVASAALKGAILFSGLYADGLTIFREPTISRDHTERLFAELGVPVRTAASIVQVDPSTWNGRIPAFEMTVPGDLSAAAFPLVAAQIVKGSHVVTRGVGVNPTRSGLLEIARDMGAGLAVEAQGDRTGEPVAEIHAWNEPLRATTAGGETLSRAVDEIPLVCALAARARGATRITVGDDLPSAARERARAAAGALRVFGVRCDERTDGIDIEGREAPLDPADIDSRGDPHIAMTAAVLALVGRAPSRVSGAIGIHEHYPKFVATLRALGARIEVQA